MLVEIRYCLDWTTNVEAGKPNQGWPQKGRWGVWLYPVRGSSSESENNLRETPSVRLTSLGNLPFSRTAAGVLCLPCVAVRGPASRSGALAPAVSLEQAVGSSLLKIHESRKALIGQAWVLCPPLWLESRGLPRGREEGLYQKRGGWMLSTGEVEMSANLPFTGYLPVRSRVEHLGGSQQPREGEEALQRHTT